jgi:hypothetical protein
MNAGEPTNSIQVRPLMRIAYDTEGVAGEGNLHGAVHVRAALLQPRAGRAHDFKCRLIVIYRYYAKGSVPVFIIAGTLS